MPYSDNIKRPRDEQTSRAFGAALEALRHKYGLTQEDLAHATGIDRTYITALCNGRHDPSISTIFLLAPILGISPTTFMRCIERERKKTLEPPPNKSRKG